MTSDSGCVPELSHLSLRHSEPLTSTYTGDTAVTLLGQPGSFTIRLSHLLCQCHGRLKQRGTGRSPDCFSRLSWSTGVVD